MIGLTEAYLIDVGAGIVAHVPLTRRLTHRDMADIEFAMVTCSEGFGDIGLRAVTSLEDRLGIGDHDRIAADLGDQVVVGAFVPLAGAHARLERLRDSITARAARTIKPAPRDRAKDDDAETLTNYYLRRYDETSKDLAEARKVRNPTARDAAIKAAGDARDSVLQAIEDVDAKAWLATRRVELAILEARRGGDLIVEDKIIEIPKLRKGKPIWRRGQKVMKRELVTSIKASARDGLETLATNHLTAAGEVRVVAGVPLTPTIDNILLAAGNKFREIYEGSDPEGGLRAVDPGAVGGGGKTEDPFGRRTVAAIQSRAAKGGKVRELEQLARMAEDEAGKPCGDEGAYVLVEVAGKGNTIRSIAGHGRKNTRLTAKLIIVLGALADHFGLQ